MPVDGAWHNRRNAGYERSARDAFRQYWPEYELNRLIDIACLPAVVFKGRNLVTITCCKCGNDRNVPSYIPWCLMSIPRFICEWCGVRA